MRRRTPSEIKAYGDGYAEAYKEFCHFRTDGKEQRCGIDAVATVEEISEQQMKADMSDVTVR